MNRIRPQSEAVLAADSRNFQRFLAMWAQDCLRLSRGGLNRPVGRDGLGWVWPSASTTVLERPDEDLSMIDWKPGVSVPRA